MRLTSGAVAVSQSAERISSPSGDDALAGMYAGLNVSLHGLAPCPFWFA